MQEKLIKSKFSQNVKSWTQLKTHLRFRVDFKCFLRMEQQPPKKPQNKKTQWLFFSKFSLNIREGARIEWTTKARRKTVGFSEGGEKKFRVVSSFSVILGSRQTPLGEMSIRKHSLECGTQAIWNGAWIRQQGKGYRSFAKCKGKKTECFHLGTSWEEAFEGWS